MPIAATAAIVFANAASSSVGKPTITSVVRLKSSSGSIRGAEPADRVAPPHAAQHPVVAGLERDVQVPRDHRRLAQCLGQLRCDVVDLDRREAEALEPVEGARLPDQAGQRETSLAIAETSEIDTGQHDLTMPMLHTPTDLGEHRVRRAAARPAADERDHAERTREGAAVLDLDERAHPVEPAGGLHAADRADIAGHCLGRILAAARYDRDVAGHGRERLRREVGCATRHEDTAARARRLRHCLPRLRDRLVRDAARVDHRNVRGARGLGMPVREEPLADRLLVRERDLAAQEAGGERGHAGRVDACERLRLGRALGSSGVSRNVRSEMLVAGHPTPS